MASVQNIQSIKVVFFSNGTLEVIYTNCFSAHGIIPSKMVSNALNRAGVQVSADSFFLADAVKRYKPASEIYQGLLMHVGKSEAPHECWLISR